MFDSGREQSGQWKRAAAAALIFVMGGLFVSSADDISDRLNEILPYSEYVLAGMIIIIITWLVVTVIIYLAQQFAPPREVKLIDGEEIKLSKESVNRIVSNLEEEPGDGGARDRENRG